MTNLQITFTNGTVYNNTKVNAAFVELINLVSLSGTVKEFLNMSFDNTLLEHFYIELENDKILIYQDLNGEKLPLLATISQIDKYKTSTCVELEDLYGV